jgi:CBS domain-containing protein
MQVRDVMSSKVATCGRDTPLNEVARLMWDGDTGFVAVVDADGKLQGAITDRDTLIAAYTTGKPLHDLTAAVAMAGTVHSCSIEAAIEEAEQKMGEFRVHRLPVVGADGLLAGVVSLSVIARKAAQDADELLEQEVGLTLGAICRPRAS